MKEKQFLKRSRRFYRVLIVICAIVLIFSIGLVYYFTNSKEQNPTLDSDYTSVAKDSDDPDRIVNGIHVRTGLVDADGLMTVVNNCTNCHSAKIIMQNRMDKERWISTIRWMQKTQNLWDLGPNEEIIVNYLVTNYPPTKKGRRQPLSNIDWYTLKN